MSFLDNLKITYEGNYGEESLFCSGLPGGTRLIERININYEYELSIQASEMHYCIPRAFVPLNEYTHFELALICRDRLTRNVDLLEDFNKKHKLLEHQEGTIYTYVPKELVQELYDYLKNNYTLGGNK